MENLSYKELQEIAKKLDIQFVGITTENLIKSIEEKRASFKTEDEAETAEEDEAETAEEETKEEVEVATENKFNGQTIIDTNVKIVNGKSYKEVKIVSGEVFLLTEEEYQKGLKK